MSKKAHTIVILDESSSMSGTRAEALGAVNQQLKAAQASEMDTDFSLVVFNSHGQARTPVWQTKATLLSDFTEKDYAPQGMTAMLDAVQDSLIRLGEIKKKDAYLVCIISDGQENDSRTTWEAVAERVKSLPKNVTIAYVGANQDLSVVSQRMNIPLGNTVAYVSSSLGTRVMASNLATASAAFYAGASNGVGLDVTRGFFGGKTDLSADVDSQPRRS